MTLEITERYPKSLAPDRRTPEAAPGWIGGIDNPYIQGLFAPTTVEATAHTLPIEGELPDELRGAYYRNGPNAQFEPTNRYHWFDGDGMVHGIWFEEGGARYANRYVDTKGLRMEREAGRAIWPGVLGPFDFTLPLAPIKDTANTDLIFANGRLMALWYESGRLHGLDPVTLESTGPVDLGVKGRISAHSKVCPHTGDLVFFSYGDRPPYMTYGVVAADGRVHQTDVDLPGARRPHDIGVTPNWSVLHDFPVFFDPEHFKRTGKRVPTFHPDVPTRFGVVPRWGSDVRWFSFEPCYMLHLVNCWEDGDWLVMIGCRTASPTLNPDPRDGQIAAMLSFLKLQANLYRWRINLVTGETDEGDLDDLNAEFPRIHPGMLGVRNRYSYHQRIPYEIPATFDGLVKYDLQRGTSERYDYPAGIFGSEAPFAPRPGATEEDDGWLLSFVTDTRDWSSACWVFDARALQEGPIAKVGLPHRVPAGFHAAWVPA